jgi:UDP-glucose 4-epimerase
MNILLTGGAGYIGSHTALSLIDQGHQVTIIDNLISGNEKSIPNKANFFKIDIANKEKIKEILEKNTFDLVMHFAGLVKVEESIQFPDKYNLYNIEKAKIFLQCCFENGLSKVIFSSTAGIYGKKEKNMNVKEADELKPSNPYAQTKLEVEKYLTSLTLKKKISCIILRYFNVAGADKNKRSGLTSVNSNNLIKVICEAALKKRKKVIINGDNYETKDGTPIRDFIHVSDLAEMHILAAQDIYTNNNSGIFNCGYGEGYSVKEVIEEMTKILNNKLSYEIGQRRENDIPYSVADITKFKEKFNWKPKYNNLNYILTSALEWEKTLK